jgi:hypothetical protein
MIDEEFKAKIREHLMDMNYTDLFDLIFEIAAIDGYAVRYALGLDDD